MLQLKDEDILNVFYEIKKPEDSHEINEIRKSIVFNHSLASNLMDEKTNCLLLDNNLKKPCHQNLMTKEDENKISTRNFGRKFSSQNDHESTIAMLSCSHKPVCVQSENVTKENFEEFLWLFSGKRNKCEAIKKQRTLAKSFTPQTCNTREWRVAKHSKDNEKMSNNLDENDTHCSSSDVLEASKSLFKTAREEMSIQKKQGSFDPNGAGQKRKLGTRRGVGSKFISPMLSNESNDESFSKSQEWSEQIDDNRLKNIEPRMIELIKSEIMDKGPTIDWDDIAGLEFAKSAIKEAVVWPMLRPELFTGLRRPPKGILLFGPPGTGKTLIGKCVASQSKSTFFSISASSLTSKWVGDGEKMVRALFAVARCYEPAVIFIDEIDSLLSQRSDTEHESSRRIKTEFLVQLDGATTDNNEKLLVIGATNRPQELDEAARRRFVKRLYIPLPELKARYRLVEQLMCTEKHELREGDLMEIAKLSEGYSGADMKNLCADATMGPVRSIDMRLIQSIRTEEVRPVNMNDFEKAFARVKSSVSPNDLDQYLRWNATYGSGSSF